MAWWLYFRENMQALHLPCPDYVTPTAMQVSGSVGTLYKFVEKYGTRVTVREMIGAGVASERWATIGTLSAAYYLGAIVGSAAVATFRVANKGMSLAEVIEQGEAMGARNRAMLHRIFLENPMILRRLLPQARPRSTQAQRPLAH